MLAPTETHLEINLNALAHNYRYLASRLKSETHVMAVVKAFGYGSDAVAIAQELINQGVSYFAVAYAKEGVALRDAGIQTPILVLHPLPSSFEVIVDRCLEPALYSLEMITAFIAFAESKQQKSYPIHLKFNTGLNRLGCSSKDMEEVTRLFSNTESIKVRSLFSHLAASEDLSERDFTLAQLASFKHISDTMIGYLGYKPLLHLLNTSGILNYPEAQYDMVRTGIGLYGFGNSEEENQHLQPVASLKTVISQIHEIEPGTSIGYNRAHKAKSFMRTATLPIGHADGISRAYGNGKGWVTLHGQRANIVGNVCMDMIMVDVTEIECNAGDEVEVFGNNPTAEKLAGSIQSISYELITAISQRVKRVVCRK